MLLGWTRLWIVVVVLYGLIVASFIVLVMLQKSNVRRDWEREREPDGTWTITMPGFAVFKNVPGSMADAELARRYRRVLKEDIEKAIEAGNKRKELEARRLLEKFEASEKQYKWSLAILGFLLWLLPSIGLYVLGRAVGWVYARFRQR